jgi:arsenite methyltransferase
VHGVDQSTAMLGAAARRFRPQLASGRLMLHQAPLERLPLETASLDGAITLNTIYFVTDLAGVFGEWARVLKPGGRLVIGLGDPDDMARQPLTAHGFHIRPLAQVTSALDESHLEVDQHQRIGSGKNAFHLLVTTPC